MKPRIVSHILIIISIITLIAAFVDINNIKPYFIGISITLLGISLIIILNTKNPHK